jgi:hypothetical protein
MADAKSHGAADKDKKKPGAGKHDDKKDENVLAKAAHSIRDKVHNLTHSDDGKKDKDHKKDTKLKTSSKPPKIGKKSSDESSGDDKEDDPTKPPSAACNLIKKFCFNNNYYFYFFKAQRKMIQQLAVSFRQINHISILASLCFLEPASASSGPKHAGLPSGGGGGDSKPADDDKKDAAAPSSSSKISNSLICVKNFPI